MSPLDREALAAACFSVARTLKWVRRPVAVADIQALSEELAKTASEFEDYLVGQDRDPNLITRAVKYIEHHHALPTGDSTSWFYVTLSALIELASPNSMGLEQNEAFYKDIEEGIAVARADFEDDPQS